MAKRSTNAMIGTYNHKCSTMREGQPQVSSMLGYISAGDTTLYDFVTTTRILSNVSYRPVHDMCLSVEHAMVGKMLYNLKATRQIPYELRTDAVLYMPLKRKKVYLAEIKFKDLHRLRDKFSDVPGVKK